MAGSTTMGFGGENGADGPAVVVAVVVVVLTVLLIRALNGSFCVSGVFVSVVVVLDSLGRLSLLSFFVSFFSVVLLVLADDSLVTSTAISSFSAWFVSLFFFFFFCSVPVVVVDLDVLEFAVGKVSSLVSCCCCFFFVVVVDFVVLFSMVDTNDGLVVVVDFGVDFWAAPGGFWVSTSSSSTMSESSL